MPSVLKALEIKKGVDNLAASCASTDEFLSAVVKFLHENMLKYNWVGFYMLEPGANPPVLVLREFQGAMTPHTRIPLDQGICGAAVANGKTIVVDDVNSDPRYLACSIETKSEIVVPIYVKGRVVGELDIDSHFPAAFAAEDTELVEYCASLVGRYLETHSQ
jgi:L-methionine (R)-S-oxide reductase